MIVRPWDTIEKVEQAFAEFNRAQAVSGQARVHARAFHEKCDKQLKGATPEEKAAAKRWLCSKLRG